MTQAEESVAKVQEKLQNVTLEPKVEEPKADEVDAESGDEGAPAAEGTEGAAAPKKKKKNKKKKKKAKQTDPPTIDIAKLFANKIYPEGELSDYVYGEENLKRSTDEEKRYLDRQRADDYNDLRKAAEAHRTVRRYAKSMIQPGMLMWDIANNIENATRAVTGNLHPHEAGVGFPTGLSINHCAAHYTPNKGDKTVLSQEDVLKVDIGIHVNGRIVDSAFTIAFEEKYDPLLEAVRAATNTGIKEAGIDVRLCDIGAAIEEVMESYEVELNGQLHPVKCIRNLNGHNIDRYRIHSGKTVPIVKNDDETKMEEGEFFAIETFGSTGNGYVIEEGECSHYARNPDAGNVPLRLNSAKSLLATIDKNFGTLPFSRRQLDWLGEDKYLLALNTLVRADAIHDYPPLLDKEGCYTAQYEHTIVLRPTCKEVVSRGDDY
ncbi:hypothetical protein DV495_005072 [Geotrichum candidum]|uniref:Methionine aminopeptidase 2 n=1 Tax=Geotrichum candidum TaxID=1173061 RepID=A0A0J9XKC1_GEOCN|nr:hypothetical protein DV495_005072 [Geotrichum candidum]KAF7498918.1 hypothetical protein DV113_003043 [Geotrichum candidum]CDO57854.1 similar to Saccharomyces cerevisiae YBL091C MAP2 Methionine aminopeptidase [Geotrichum candidum]